jgi:hypothetical protein
MKVHPYPFASRKVSKNLDKWIKLGHGETYIAYLNPWMLVGPNAGYVITNRRLIEFDKSKTVHDVALKAITSVGVDVQIEEYLTTCYLTIQAGSTRLAIKFGSDEWQHLLEFIGHLGKGVGKTFDLRDTGLQPRREQLMQTVKAPLVKVSIARNLSLKTGEEPVAYCTNRIAAGTLEYVLTTKRLMEYAETGISWEVPLGDIRSFEYGAMGYLHVHTKDGKKRSMSVKDYYSYDAWVSLIEDTRQGRLKKAAAAEAPARKTAVPLTYPLELSMESRGWLEGFKFEVRNAKKHTVYLIECRDGQTMHIARGDTLETIVRAQEPQKHYTFETPDGRPTGAIKRVKDGLLGSGRLEIIDSKGESAGCVRKKPGVKAWAKRAYLFDLSEQTVLEIRCSLQSPLHTVFEIDRISKVSQANERLALNCVFALRLIEPDIMKDPVKSTVKDIRGGFKDSIEDIF